MVSYIAAGERPVMGNGPLGTKHNSPVIDSGTLARSKSPAAAKRSRRRRNTAGAVTVSKGYVIVGSSVKGLLPDRTWEQARNRIDDLFQKAGGLQTVYVRTIKHLPYLNLSDSVVECYFNAIQATVGFRINVYNAVNASGHKIPELKSLARRFNQPDYYTVSVGRSFTVKSIFNVPPYRPRLVCITYGVISMTNAFSGSRGFFVKKKTNTTLATLGSAPQKEQLSFGITLGNLIAHELRHQLAFSKTGLALDHSGSGLGMDGADFSNPTIQFSPLDRGNIASNFKKLRLAQNAYTS